jgi:hypothetical protein
MPLLGESFHAYLRSITAYRGVGMCTLQAVVMFCFIFDEESFSKMFIPQCRCQCYQTQTHTRDLLSRLLLDLPKIYDDPAWRSKFMGVFVCVFGACTFFLGFSYCWWRMDRDAWATGIYH